MRLLGSHVQKYLYAFLIVGALLGIIAPSAAHSLKPLILPCLAFLLFFPALKVKGRSFASILLVQPQVWGVSLLMMFGIIPLLMYCLGRAARLENALLVGLVLASAGPSMISAPYFTDLVGGSVEAAFWISIVSTMLAPFIIPLTLHLLGGVTTTTSTTAVAIAVLLVLIVPTTLATVIKSVSPRLAASLLTTEDLFTPAVLMLINWVIVGTNRVAVVNSASQVFITLLALGLFQDFGIFFLTRRASRCLVTDDLSKALAVSFGLKNVALVGGLMVNFSEPMALASGVVSLAHVLMFITIGVFKDRL